MALNSFVVLSFSGGVPLIELSHIKKSRGRISLEEQYGSQTRRHQLPFVSALRVIKHQSAQ